MANLGREEFFPPISFATRKRMPVPSSRAYQNKEDWKGALSIPAGLLTAVALLAARPDGSLGSCWSSPPRGPRRY